MGSEEERKDEDEEENEKKLRTSVRKKYVSEKEN